MRARIETEAFGDPTHQAIFMVSGWAMSKEVMHAFAQRLSQRFYVVLANLPGISLDEQWISRSRIGPNYDIDALTEQLIDVAPKESWWIGWSLGGMVSTYVAARRSSCVRGLITLSASPSFIRRDDYSFGMSVADFDAFSALVESAPEQGVKHLVALQVKGAEDENALANQLQSFLPIKTLNHAALIGGLRLLKSLDLRREWSILDLPNLHLLGGKDTLVFAQALEQQVNVNPLQKCVVLPNCTHLPFLENQDECVLYIERFIYSNTL
ncbi:carboxylesterase [Marinomonas ushuaiensis DSM 15871]|uniref:Carboxylesterase n=1 Tax=Marinomonas ushuaiensis DSM 15871 TaxID=1122207 RepID=X7E6X7_9GAMM|nr:alpha/beta fold hydrolase [Marinomonas ushuaiensis]ETX10911.1 carboxylesterase [Marinomonas ushuaiensis DSM 15871]